MPRNMFVLELKKSDVSEPVAPVSQERSVPAVVPVVQRPVAPTTGKPWPGRERRGGSGKGGHGVDARRRRSGASRFRG
jgi:hypothetical protein